MRSGEDYVESLDEGRTVFVNGDEAENVAKHPAFTGVVKTLAIIGIAREVAEVNGIDRIPSVQEKLGELASLAATVDDLVLSSEASPEKVAPASARTTGHADPALFRQVMGDQMAVSNVFSRPGEVRLRDMDYDLLDGEAPILHGGLGYVRCTVDAVHDGADHLIVVGAVRHCEVRQGEPPTSFADGTCAPSTSMTTQL